MRQIVLRLIVALLAFVVGVTCAISYRAVTSYQVSVLRAREAVLRDDLYQMRWLIDQYAADKGTLPKSLNNLVSAGYLPEIPQDPFTGHRDWIVVMGDDPNSSEGAKGIIDVRSSSSVKSREGAPYKEW